MAFVKKVHQIDLQEVFGEVYLPYALERKYPNANREFRWQYLFPSQVRSIDPRSSKERGHHLHHTVLQEAIKEAIKKQGFKKPAVPIPCATALPLICWKMGTISEPYRNYWDIKARKPP